MKWDEIVLVSIKTTSNETNKEIIEVGLCNFNTQTYRKNDLISLFVKPVNSKVTPHCTKITGITPFDLIDGVDFFDLCDFMKENYKTQEKPWASYGNFTENIFKRQCWEFHHENPLSDRFFNIRHLFPLLHKEKEEISLRDALSKLNISVGSNSCEDEVLNTGILLAEILRGRPLLRS